MADAVAALHPYTAELFTEDDARKACIKQGILPDASTIQPKWNTTIEEVFTTALLEVPEVAFPQLGGRSGQHTECFGYLLAELQYVQRAYPGAQW